MLGRLNGLAQTLSAAGRSVSPLVAGSLFSLSSRMPFKGELLPFTALAGVSIFGLVLSCGIRDPRLEGQDWDGPEAEGEPLLEEGRERRDDE